ncbi:hypothetical protein Tco_0002064 [Tanacetum coccineum]
MSTLKFAETHNLVAFLSKPEESAGFEEIVDFLNSTHIKYALTVNPTVYESCIEQFWATAKAKIVNGERQIQALVDKKKVIITETSVKSDLILEDAEGTECLPNDVIFEQLTLMGAKTTAWNAFSSTIASAIICLATNQNFNFSKYIFDNMMKNLEGGVKFLMYPRFVQEKVFPGKVTPLFQTMMVQAPEDMGEDLVAPTDPHPTPIITQPSSSKPQKKQSRRKQKKDSGLTEPITDEATNEEHVSTPFYDLPQSGEDRLQLTELMSLCTNLQKQVLDLEEAKTAQAKEIASLKKRGRKIADINQDAEVTLIDETQGRSNDNLMFDTGVLDMAEKEVDMAKKDVSTTDSITTASEAITTASVDAVTTATTITTTTRPKARGVVVQEPSEFTTTTLPSQALQLPRAKDKGKAKIVEPKKPLKRKDQIAFDEEVARNLEAQLQAELEEEERLARQKEKEANIALIESWDNTQAMMDADFQLCQQMQAEEQE